MRGMGRRTRVLSGICDGCPMLTAVALAQATSWGILFYGIAVFLTPMHEDLGWSVAGLTGAYSLALLVSGVVAVPVGHWLDRHGPRALMTVGSLAAALVVAWSQVSNLIVFCFIWARIGVAMAAVCYEPAVDPCRRAARPHAADSRTDATTPSA